MCGGLGTVIPYTHAWYVGEQAFDVHECRIQQQFLCSHSQALFACKPFHAKRACT